MREGILVGHSSFLRIGVLEFLFRSSAINGILIFRMLLDPIALLGPPWLGRFFIGAIPNNHVRTLRNIVDVMHTRSVEIVTEKKVALSRGDEALARQVGEGKDVMSILRE